MAIDSLKKNVSDFKVKKDLLSEKESIMSIDITRVDELLLSVGDADAEVSDAFQGLKRGMDLDIQETVEERAQLEQVRKDIKQEIYGEQEKLDAAQTRLERLTGKRYAGTAGDALRKTDDRFAQFQELLSELEEDPMEGAGAGPDSKPNSIVSIDGKSYRTDDNGKPHMERGPDGEYHVLPNSNYTVNGYYYQTDSQGRIVHAEGTLKAKDGARKALNAKVSDMGPDDQRGHIIGDLLNGSNQNDNLVAQLGTVNQGYYKILEMEFASMYSEHHEVYGNYSISYDSGTMRPSSITVDYAIDGGSLIPQASLFEKLEIDQLASYSSFEGELLELQDQGHEVLCNYSVVFSNYKNDCWITVEYSIDGGMPFSRDFKNRRRQDRI